ncbi:MAG: hypothetical protein EOL89_06060 [Actinobacteria bacterium]|nr:hypothetical protein [Actinomycetota bacterium]
MRKNNRSRAGTGFIAFALVMTMAACGGAESGGDGTESAGAATSDPDRQATLEALASEQAAVAEENQRRREEAEASAAAAAEVEAEASAAAAAAAMADQSYSGSGTDIITFSDFGDNAVIATISHEGWSNFQVWSVDGQGGNLDLLINTIGDYSGTVPLNFTDDPAALKIEADGTWTVTTSHLNTAPRWDGSSPYNGTGDSVLITAGAAEGLTPVTITNSGDSNFTVWAWGDSDRDLLVNEIGNYNGTTLLPAWALLVVVESDGGWSISK